MKKLKIFCLPYAGGSAAVFAKWKRYMDASIDLVPMELAGRGKRIGEPLYANAQAAVDDVFRLIKEKVDVGPYALFGHSMGAMIAFELSHKIRRNGLRQPNHIFLSGRGAPHVKRQDEKKYHLMESTQFREEVVKLGGTPPEVFEHNDLAEFILPLLMNDFKIVETASRNDDIQPLDINLTIFFGKDEDLTSEQCDGWKKHTTKRCSIHYFEGGHFFIHNETEQIINLINTIVREV